MPKVQHIALLKFRPGTTQATIDRCFQELAALRQHIDGLESFHGGAYSSPEGLNKGFTHGFVMIFASPAARDSYLPHPEHERVKQVVLPHVADVVVFDFEM